jgi:hypothetical protein
MCPHTDTYVSSYHAAQSYTPQDVAVIMNALAHHAMRDVALTRHLATAWAAATAPATGPPPAEGAGAAGVGGGGGAGEGGGGRDADVQAICNILHALASLNIRKTSTGGRGGGGGGAGGGAGGGDTWQGQLYEALLTLPPAADTDVRIYSIRQHTSAYVSS